MLPLDYVPDEISNILLKRRFLRPWWPGGKVSLRDWRFSSSKPGYTQAQPGGREFECDMNAWSGLPVLSSSRSGNIKRYIALV
ncbi:hypothetical protein AVEN_28593-1 [Araneus ventricosus]|uniref:Uncharacterized protein n=1 Tax=Araneus ventricosus TaxID=182803 RepID=A0A4Y2DH09_ARAVE|nr:hypothetical protein AVEN_28593-1 [Araneus ventricosus]